MPSGLFERWIIKPTKLIVDLVEKTHPNVDIIGFPKGVGVRVLDYVKGTGVSGLSLDYTQPLEWVHDVIPPDIVLQGNLDPSLLVVGGDVMVREVSKIHQTLKDRPYIFNLGHGILPNTPIEHVEQLVKQVRGLEK